MENGVPKRVVVYGYTGFTDASDATNATKSPVTATTKQLRPLDLGPDPPEGGFPDDVHLRQIQT